MTTKPFDQPSPSRKVSMQRMTSIRRTSKGDLLRLSPNASSYPLVETNIDSKQHLPDAFSNRRTPSSNPSEPWNKDDVIVTGDNSAHIGSRILRKDLTLQIATKRTDELITAINQHIRNPSNSIINNNNNNNHMSQVRLDHSASLSAMHGRHQQSIDDFVQQMEELRLRHTADLQSLKHEHELELQSLKTFEGAQRNELTTAKDSDLVHGQEVTTDIAVQTKAKDALTSVEEILALF